MNALEELNEILNDGEIVESIVFGAWGWGLAPDSGENWEPGYGEPEPPPVPFAMRGKLIDPNEAGQYMNGWSFSGGYGAPDCYATYIWTNQRVLWVTQYDGATGLDSAPRHPIATIPDMPGG